MIVRLVALMATGAAVATAQPGTQTAAVPIRTLSPVAARTTAPLLSVGSMVRELPGKKLLVNDAGARRLLLFDSTLSAFTVLRDSVDGLPNSYGLQTSAIIPYLGDSSLFVDQASRSLLVIDPAGAFTRVMSMPAARELNLLLRAFGPGVDAQGRLIYRGSPQRDSTPVVRADFDTRRIDTIGRVKIAIGLPVWDTIAGKQRRRSVHNPMPTLDEWTTMADGSVAFVRGQDYHVEWVNADGTRSSSPKMPFDWRRVSDEEKQRVSDSALVAMRRNDSTMAVTLREMDVRAGRPPDASAGAVTERIVVPINEMPDYFPPIRTNAIRADLDNNIWILPATTAQSLKGELVYDVVNRKGELFERVRLPEGRSIAGFGRGGTVYLMWRDGNRGWFLERTSVVR